MIRSFIYDTLILRLTSRWYAEVLRRVPAGATLLDVGIGTAGALLANDDLVKQKCLRVVGIDIDADYIARAQQRLQDSSLAGLAEVRLESVYADRNQWDRPAAAWVDDTKWLVALSTASCSGTGVPCTPRRPRSRKEAHAASARGKSFGDSAV